MRVIGGKFRSRVLAAQAGMDTRPTSDRLRETLFNVLTQGAVDRVDGGVFLDLYAGSGAVGIEALSRGAASVTFVEQGAAALRVVEKNLAGLGLDARSRREGIRIEKAAVLRFLRGGLERGGVGPFGVMFLDPPYDAAAEYAAVLELLGGDGRELLVEGALVVAEHRGKDDPGESFGALRRVRLLKQGDAALSFYEVSG
ncbi:16S rRNA (guanine(966)-N(2))-methyltransferase RsmD [Acidicapsa dinghuensis]|uniref:16S rRNA (Guanine(966)-N(2))-methyltransferase RsmD n=1 Tax=Acidicapsa dinghuensis TaxID=2218256 RepID=A0ABW1EKD1_9BACT|nr:16S rRNA (guanine(966)-N(2))-methyltransferase RsmD [Acidicapsa dinghuensis]